MKSTFGFLLALIITSLCPSSFAAPPLPPGPVPPDLNAGQFDPQPAAHDFQQGELHRPAPQRFDDPKPQVPAFHELDSFSQKKLNHFGEQLSKWVNTNPELAYLNGQSLAYVAKTFHSNILACLKSDESRNSLRRKLPQLRAKAEAAFAGGKEGVNHRNFRFPQFLKSQQNQAIAFYEKWMAGANSAAVRDWAQAELETIGKPAAEHIQKLLVSLLPPEPNTDNGGFPRIKVRRGLNGGPDARLDIDREWQIIPVVAPAPVQPNTVIGNQGLGLQWEWILRHGSVSQYPEGRNSFSAYLDKLIRSSRKLSVQSFLRTPEGRSRAVHLLYLDQKPHQELDYCLSEAGQLVANYFSALLFPQRQINICSTGSNRSTMGAPSDNESTYSQIAKDIDDKMHDMDESNHAFDPVEVRTLDLLGNLTSCTGRSVTQSKEPAPFTDAGPAEVSDFAQCMSGHLRSFLDVIANKAYPGVRHATCSGQSRPLQPGVFPSDGVFMAPMKHELIRVPRLRLFEL